jgi:hypothetical protein
MIVRAGLVAGGALAMTGAVLPWLTLFAGLQQYSGMIGVYGRIAFAVGFAGCVAGALTPRKLQPLLLPVSLTIGIALLTFAIWLYEGVLQIVQRPDSLMLVARSGPGLFVLFAGGALFVCAPFASWVLLFTGNSRRRDAY